MFVDQLGIQRCPHFWRRAEPGSRGFGVPNHSELEPSAGMASRIPGYSELDILITVLSGRKVGFRHLLPAIQLGYAIAVAVAGYVENERLREAGWSPEFIMWAETPLRIRILWCLNMPVLLMGMLLVGVFWPISEDLLDSMGYPLAVACLAIGAFLLWYAIGVWLDVEFGWAVAVKSPTNRFARFAIAGGLCLLSVAAMIGAFFYKERWEIRLSLFLWCLVGGLATVRWMSLERGESATGAVN
jgi:hypothetical protein